MKAIITILAGVMAAALAVGCASSGTALHTPVGPSPAVAKTGDEDGLLKVFSAKEKEDVVGNEFPYSERTAYAIYDSQGNEVKGVQNNNKGEYGAEPKGIRLAPGTYHVKALAAVGMGEWVSVPVVIEAGRTTEVHLNGQWRSPSDTPENELVYSPSGFPMGWKAEK